MKRFPWPAGGDTSSTSSADPAQEEAQGDEWEQLQAEVTCPDRTLSELLLFYFCLQGQREKCPLMCQKSVSVYVCLSAAGSGPSVHPDQSDPQSAGRPAEAELSGAASPSSEDGGSASGLLLPAAPRPADRQHAPHQHGQNLTAAHVLKEYSNI